MTAGHTSHNQSVSITVGNSQVNVTNTTKLTPAEYLALIQVERTGQQTLVLSAQGNASGGEVVIDQHLARDINNLVIPQGVTVVDLTKSGTLNVKGNLTDDGSLYIEPKNSSLSGVSVSANNIDVQAQGSLSNAVPAGTLNTSNIGPTSSNVHLNLSLNAVNNITNAGSITSSGNLNLNAGGSITNALPVSTTGAMSAGGATGTTGATSATGATPTIQAASNVNLTTGSGNVHNAGLIQSINGSINISSSDTGKDININGNGGTFQAQNGNINVRDAAYTGTGNININGGNYLSRNLNLYSGTGTITGLTGQISGNLNTQAAAEHFIAETSDLNLGNNTITGDPTFVSTGNITITGANTFTENVAIIAQGSITGDSAAAIVDIGHDVTLIAGATVTVSTGGTSNSGTTTIPTSTQNISGATGTGNGTGSYTATVNLAAPTGGNIDLSNSSAATVIDTSNGSGKGGNVTLVALANGGTGGNVSLNTSSSINTSGTGTGNGGNVAIYAGANSGTSITIGSINTDGGGTSGSSGSVTIATTQAVTSNGSPLVFNANGSITSGNTIQAGPMLAHAGISSGAIDTEISSGTGTAGNVTISAYGSIDLTSSIQTNSNTTGGGVTLTSSSGSITASGEIFTLANTQGGNVIISAYGSINMNTSDIATDGSAGSGGNVTLTSSHGSVSIVEIDGYTVGAGSGGNVAISANGSISVPNGVYIANYGGTGSGGSLTATSSTGSISTGEIDTYAQSVSSGTGAGGNVTLTATNGSVQTGSIFTSVNNTLGVGNAGNITISAYGPINLTAVVQAINEGTGSAGSISLTSSHGSVSTQEIDTYQNNSNSTGSAGNITISAYGDINAGGGLFANNFGGTASGGNVTLTSSTGSVFASSQITSSAGGTGPGGNVVISAYGPISVDTYGIFSGGSTGTAGDVTVTSSNSSISILGIESNSSGAGQGGNASITAHGSIEITNGLDLSSSMGKGGSFTASSGTSSVSTGEIDTNCVGGLYSSGTVNVSAYSDITLERIFTFNNGGVGTPGAGGAVTLTSTHGSVGGSVIDTTSAGAGPAGNITISAGGSLSFSSNILADNIGTSSGGTITIKDANATSPLYIGSATGTNYIGGSISAMGGLQGGTINLLTASNVIVSSNLTANSGASGAGGKIQFTYIRPGGGPVRVENDGSISATNTGTNTSGIIGLNGGANYPVKLTGSGTLFAGNYVGMGYLNPITLAVINGAVVPATRTNNFVLDTVTVHFPNGGSPILNKVIVGATPSPPPLPPPSPSRLPSAPPAPLLPPSSSSSGSGLTPQQILFNELKFLALLQSLQQHANTRLYEQLGTRVATDYTPYTKYPMQPQKYPLQGNISMNRQSIPGEAKFAASSFSANELNALAQNGVVFGPTSNNEFLDLIKGFILFMPNRDIQVQTREGIAYIPKGAAAWVMETGNDAAIYDLHDSVRSGAIKVKVNGKDFVLAPGRELLLTRNTKADFASLNPGNALGYHNVKSTEVGSDIKAYVCDFSIAHGMADVPVIHSLLVSSDPAERSQAHKILKNAAILSDLSGNPDF